MRTGIMMMVFTFITFLIWITFYHLIGIIPFDFYDYGIKEDLSSKHIYWRFTDRKVAPHVENTDKNNNYVVKVENVDAREVPPIGNFRNNNNH